MKAVKWYPAGATTNSDFGCYNLKFTFAYSNLTIVVIEGVKETDIEAVRETLLAMVKA